ncbi:purine-cytosine permease family protein [Microcella frigidaquae]|uniref:NCS1 nucleoside transporter family n=1 Tax=Microcella frigidaquae TaxID=424758 RepID=A0A840X353_9MICO|nr:cytosine permease [Microcella frigidaquae]MBB5616923.1 NCS1 nucleoside transporter family [Microcella frigidaquae]NHN43642.1 cytosine permease [Microcella frigidaquae]
MSETPVIERRSIDYIPWSERRGKLWHQAPFWFTGNFVLPTMVVGFIGPQIGLSVGFSFLAILLGACFGTFFMAFHANQGPRMGLPQMIQSRAQFGSRGAVVPFLATVFVYVGFSVFNVVLAAEGLGLILPAEKAFWYPVVTIAGVLIAVFGHHLLHFIQRWLVYFVVVSFAVVTIVALTTLPAPVGIEAGGWNLNAFLVQFSLAAGYNISYAVYVSDYSRYLPANSSAPRLIFFTYIGAAASAVWMMSLGALISSRLPGVDAVEALNIVGDNFFVGFGIIVVLIATVANLSIMSVNMYGAMLTSVSAVDSFKSVPKTRTTRVVGLVVIGLAVLVVALILPDDLLGAVNNFVILMLYFLVPWTAVNLVDFYWVRRGKYAITEIFRSDGIYGRWSWRGLTAYFLGLVSMVPFVYLPGVWEGSIAVLVDGADFSFAIGLVVSGVAYLLLARGIDHEAEAEARRASERELEGTVAE